MAKARGKGAGKGKQKAASEEPEGLETRVARRAREASEDEDVDAMRKKLAHIRPPGAEIPREEQIEALTALYGKERAIEVLKANEAREAEKQKNIKAQAAKEAKEEKEKKEKKAKAKKAMEGKERKTKERVDAVREKRQKEFAKNKLRPDGSSSPETGAGKGEASGAGGGTGGGTNGTGVLPPGANDQPVQAPPAPPAQAASTSWTDEQRQFVQDLVDNEDDRIQRELYQDYQAAFPGTRTLNAISSMHSRLRTAENKTEKRKAGEDDTGDDKGRGEAVGLVVERVDKVGDLVRGQRSSYLMWGPTENGGVKSLGMGSPRGGAGMENGRFVV
ncbi:hypothetical protein K402DRAFT_424610 [Aulographum hederae CBS 113979]|uniref:Uncharacterized protein n=1 Tax=Aulographum hederae CBS 113979 TaxID=1176131 RepID=A0A6G1GND0_9PEZI|nr:hypothetical protein K402DRAFT_424610 [Aulographum hederae CBS 113979]